MIKKEVLDPDLQPKVAEDDIFGGAVSDSEDEDAHLNVLDVIDENSQNSGEDSRLTDSNSVLVSLSCPDEIKCCLTICIFQNTSDQKLITEFSSEMFEASSSMLQEVDYYGQMSSNMSFSEPGMSFAEPNLSRGKQLTL